MPDCQLMITVPVAVHAEPFNWQLDLFWFAHRTIYGGDAYGRAHAIIVRRNHACQNKATHMVWNIDVPHTMCEAFFDVMLPRQEAALSPERSRIAVPLNIQIGLMQVLHLFPDEQLLEITDCDMFHFRRSAIPPVQPGELLVSDVYENWHLFSLTTNRHVIAPYFSSGANAYNGGFVPIIGHVSTFKRILPEWTAIHIDILRREYDDSILWWAGMFALQAACEKPAFECSRMIFAMSRAPTR